MKTNTLFTVKLIAMMLLVSGSAIAGNGNYFGLFVQPVKNEKKADFTVVNGKQEHLEILILDEDGKKFFSERISSDEQVYRKRFNLVQLDDGNYSVKVKKMSNGDVLSSRSMVLSATGIALKNGRDKREDVPFHVQQKDGNLIVSYLNQKEETVTMEIRDGEGNLVYKHQFGKGIAISKKFDISDLWPGEYHVALVSETQKIISTLKR